MICEDFSQPSATPCTKPATESTPSGWRLCQTHADLFWERRQRIDNDYPDSDVAPSWFDPTYAGESWGDDY